VADRSVPTPRGAVALAWIAAGLACVAADAAADRFLDSFAAPPVAASVFATLCAFAPWGLVALAFAATRGLLASERVREADAPTARIRAEDARRLVAWVWGGALAALMVAFLLAFVSANDGRIRQIFLDFGLITRGAPALWKGFLLNAKIAFVAEALVLVWALLVAVLRQLPGPGAAPLRWLAIAYCDVFRGVPAVIVVYAIVLGFPLASVPPFAGMADKDLQRMSLAVLALVLVYGAYLAEVYRAGLDSVHPSQVAAARSLGLSEAQALRFVVVPQAVRRMVPPLLNDFIALQKDTALVSFAGLVDILGQANLLKNKYFNLSPVTGAALFFLVVTVPMTRFVDHLLAKDAARKRAG
jgi:polar amino acid transport system permease protein